MSLTAETSLPTSKKETIRKILELQKKNEELESLIDVLEFTNRSFKLYSNIGTAVTIRIAYDGNG